MSIPTESTSGGDITADQGLGPTLTNSDVSEELRLLRARIAQLERQQTMNSPTSSDGFYLVSNDEIEPNNNDKESMAYPEKEQATFDQLENKMEEYHNKQQQTIDAALTEKQNVDQGIELSNIDRDNADLLNASRAGKVDAVRFLLSKGARVDRTTDQGFSLLFLAAREGHLEVCKLLIAKGADTNQKANNGRSPWLMACEKGHLDIVKLFVKNGQDIEAAGSIGYSAFLTAILEKEKKFLRGSASKKYKQENSSTGLMHASRAGEVGVVRFLLSKGARVDWTSDEGFTPLFLAVREGHLEVCKLLVDGGADTNQKANNGRSPWLMACKKGLLDIVEYFVGEGQDIEATDRNGLNGLMYATSFGKTSVGLFLLTKSPHNARIDANGVV